ncbi:MAG: phosphoglycerate kinase [Flavobacteriales bacterium]
MKTINDFNFKDKKALVRVDFNVPLNEHGEITDDTRIQAAKPTILKILGDNGSCVLISHLGRPKGVASDKYSLKHIVNHLTNVLNIQVKFVSNCVGKEVEEAMANLKSGEILLLENLRFHKEEKEGNQSFAKELAKWGDIYVNDAFGTAHRAHASTAVVAEFFGENKCFGYLLAKEIEAINKVLKDGEKPVTAILGGSKVSSKITIIENILPAVDNLIIGGGMTYTFVKALGGEIGNSICEDDKLQLALDILEAAKQQNVEVFIGEDSIVANDFSNEADRQIVLTKEIPAGWQGLDIGPKTIAKFSEVVYNSKTILWNGPLGVFEMENFAVGTKAIGNAIFKATKNGAFSLVGGGDSVAAVKKFNYADKVSYVSTGGGAMLESLEGRELPGVAAILK